ncbi:MAG: AAA family ATPase [Candidatus Omnitrophica bacterium]|jgi:general secretion pathway protein A|nr:AAA family ATPase [Candidatus Omnitrophota bacterium]
MYETFYGLREKPFSVTPDSRFFFPSEKHTEALDSLIYAINDRKGFVAVTGEVGCGKTTVWHALINKLDAGTKIAIITNTNLTAKQILISILDDLEVHFKDSWTKVRLLVVLNKYLLEQASLGFNVVVLIDEAQNLKFDVLEEVRMLSNLETEREKLLQIVLMGQPQLKEKLKLEKFQQLKQRISVYYHIDPLSLKEAKDYINHRLKVAGLSDSRVVFDPFSLFKIYDYSAGVPRIVNTICDRCLLTGFIREKEQISGEIVEEVAKELGIEKLAALKEGAVVEM